MGFETGLIVSLYNLIGPSKGTSELVVYVRDEQTKVQTRQPNTEHRTQSKV